jgi:hypothetical protein
MQTPPKDRSEGFKYAEPMLCKAVTISCSIEETIYNFGKNDGERSEKFRSLYYALAMKYTEIKDKLLNGELSADELIKMQPKDFLTEEEKQKREKDDEIYRASLRTDWMREELRKG